MSLAYWEFNEADPSQVDVELTQRDQFNNDDVDLTEALVREAIQNSSDAAVDQGGDNVAPVKVAFTFAEIAGENFSKLRNMLMPLEPHLSACEIEMSALTEAECRVLLIEDFNTHGLTGKTGELDEGHFRSFWRRHGRSGKAGNKGGRWGLGKLVYSSSSLLRTFFGLTIRHGEGTPLLMGQAVLANHEIGEKRYHAHGFWFAERAENRLQLPLTDPGEISEFQDLLGLRRSDESGLSIAVPCLARNITPEGVINAVLTNYYFPILSGKLEVEVNHIHIDQTSFMDLAATIDVAKATGVPFDFITEVSSSLEGDAEFEATQPIGKRDLDEDFFGELQLTAMKERYAKGELVRARIPVHLTRKDGTDHHSAIDLFLRPLPEGQKSFALFARGPITLPGERRYFQGSAAYGALIANDNEIAAFLGDAENPAHTAWNSNAEKLAKNWANRQNTLKRIRYALRDFYGLVAEQIESEDTNALIDFFSLADQGVTGKGKRKRSPKPKPEPKPRENALSIRPRVGGFEVKSGPAASEWTFPRRIRVRVAYDMIGRNPFKAHSKYDFDLQKEDITLKTSNAAFKPLKANILILEATSPDFSLEASGFDPNRDIVVDARAV